MVVSDRPQERLERHGAEALSDREILAMILRSGPKGVDVLTMSGQLIDQAGSLSRLLRWSAEDFQTIHVFVISNRCKNVVTIQKPHFIEPKHLTTFKR